MIVIKLNVESKEQICGVICNVRCDLFLGYILRDLESVYL